MKIIGGCPQARLSRNHIHEPFQIIIIGILFKSTRGTTAQASWDDTCRWTTGFAAALPPMPQRPQLAAPFQSYAACDLWFNPVPSQVKLSGQTTLNVAAPKRLNNKSKDMISLSEPWALTSPKSFAASWPIARRKGSCHSVWHILVLDGVR